MKKLLFIIIALVLIIGGSLLLNNNQSKTRNNKLQVTTSFYPLYFLASQIGGDKADVLNITPAGAEPHEYDPTAQDVARIEKSKLLILNGIIEPWGNKIKDNLQGSNTIIITAGEDLLTKQLTEAGQATKDPHVWLDPILAKKEAAKITAGFIQADPTNSSYYKSNEKNLDEKLDQLDAKFQQNLKVCQTRDIVTSHAAFGYLAEQYNLKQVSIAGLSPDEEPSSKQLAETAKFAKDNNIKYIFFESLVSPKLSETIASEIGAKTLVLDPLEGISDNDIKQGKNYFTVMENNLKNLQEALGCNP